MPKNILIFADGTGNEGGLLPDESRTNVYKLFRATRTGPDSSIDPAKQMAFYIRGIGTSGNGSSFRAKCHNTAHQMFGGGFTSRVIDCYLAVISVWQPGDRIYIFGFSRGAYIARCVAHLLELCGVPTKQPGADALSLKPGDLRKVAKTAVRILYRFGMPTRDDDHRQFAVDQFRKNYGSPSVHRRERCHTSLAFGIQLQPSGGSAFSRNGLTIFIIHAMSLLADTLWLSTSIAQRFPE